MHCYYYCGLLLVLLLLLFAVQFYCFIHVVHVVELMFKKMELNLTKAY